MRRRFAPLVLSRLPRAAARSGAAFDRGRGGLGGSGGDGSGAGRCAGAANAGAVPGCAGRAAHGSGGRGPDGRRTGPGSGLDRRRAGPIPERWPPTIFCRTLPPEHRQPVAKRFRANRIFADADAIASWQRRDRARAFPARRRTRSGRPRRNGLSMAAVRVIVLPVPQSHSPGLPIATHAEMLRSALLRT